MAIISKDEYYQLRDILVKTCPEHMSQDMTPEQYAAADEEIKVKVQSLKGREAGRLGFVMGMLLLDVDITKDELTALFQVAETKFRQDDPADEYIGRLYVVAAFLTGARGLHAPLKGGPVETQTNAAGGQA